MRLIMRSRIAISMHTQEHSARFCFSPPDDMKSFEENQNNFKNKSISIGTLFCHLSEHAILPGVSQWLLLPLVILINVKQKRETLKKHQVMFYVQIDYKLVSLLHV